MKTYHVTVNGWIDARQAQRLESDLRLLPGVTDVSTAADTGGVIVRGRDGLQPHITRALNHAGYELASDPTPRRTAFALWYRQGWLTEPSRAA